MPLDHTIEDWLAYRSLSTSPHIKRTVSTNRCLLTFSPAGCLTASDIRNKSLKS